MRHLQPALIACLLTLGHPALAHDATPGNSAEVSDCDRRGRHGFPKRRRTLRGVPQQR